MTLNSSRIWILRIICVNVLILWLIAQYNDRKTNQKSLLSFYHQKFLLSLSPDIEQQARRHLGYLKVHKTGSGTLHNIFARFALKHRVTIVLPFNGIHILENPDHLSWNLLPVPKDHEFEMLFNHVIFRARRLRNYLPNDTIFIASVREPFSQFVSAFTYFRSIHGRKDLTNSSISSSIHSFLTNPSVYESSTRLSLTHNSMTRDFGYPPAYIDDIQLFKKYLNKLGDFFHLVIVLERFDESMVVLRRLLNWSVKEVLYISINNQKYNITYKKDDRTLHQKWSQLDYILYDFFYKKVNRQIAEQKNDFYIELALYKQSLKEVQEFCLKDRIAPSITFDKTDFSPEFTVSKDECKLMTAKEKDLMNILVIERKEMLKTLGEKSHYLRKFHDKVKLSPSIQLKV